MYKREHLIYMLDFNRRALEIDLAELTEEDTLVRLSDDTPHIRWYVGHLVVSAAGLARILGGGDERNEEYVKLFERGSVVSADGSIYPPFAELKDELFRLLNLAREAAGKLSDEQLDQDLPPEIEFQAKVMNAACFLCMHTFYHTGQITLIRRTLGRERPFG